MKQMLWVMVLMVLLSGILSAQKQETLFQNASVVGGFGGPIAEFGLNNGINTSLGGGGGIVINSFFLGGYGLGSLDFGNLFDEEEDLENLEIGHGGLWLGYTLRPYSIAHLYSSVRIGWGAVEVDFDQVNSFSDTDQVFVLTPEVGAEINLTRWWRLAGAVGYRWVNGARDDLGYEDADFSGTVISATMRFGWFGSNYNSRRSDDW